MSADALPVWLTRVEVATRLNVPVETLAYWGRNGRGPRYAKFGRHARYALADVVAWEQAQLEASA